MLDTFSKVSSLLYNNGIEDFNHTVLSTQPCFPYHNLQATDGHYREQDSTVTFEDIYSHYGYPSA